MDYKNVLITGGAGFVGSHICLNLKRDYPDIKVTALDNLRRRGSELNIPRLRRHEVEFIHADIRNREDLRLRNIDLLIECSAEPSVMAGVTSSPEYLLDTNLGGAINCFELARREKADVIFLSTSRIYPVESLNELKYRESETRYNLLPEQRLKGASEEGISEEFPLYGVRTLYGATKLSAELILQEYVINYGINAVINRCGLIAGPGQLGKVDQGVITYWIAMHYFERPLSYIGFGGEGKQVRDVLHIGDLYDLIKTQLTQMNKHNGRVYNAGGGEEFTVSLRELTELCRNFTGKSVEINSVEETRPGDVRIYITDNSKVTAATGWRPQIGVESTLKEVYDWINENESRLKYVFE